jgi:hypothetical protein
LSTEILEALQQLHIDLDSISDPGTRASVVVLLNSVEKLARENQQQKEEIGSLKDEINRLKGEQGRPNIRPQKKDGDISSEDERKDRSPQKPKKKSKEKKSKIVVHRSEVCLVDKSQLPSDVISKGYDTVVIQDIVIRAENTAYRREVYYSPSEKRSFMAELPFGCQGEFGPGVRTLVLCLYHDAGMSQPNIHRLLETAGLYISKATISRMITDNLAVFHEEKSAVVAAGLESTDYQHLDDTSARVNGVNHYNHVLCNPLYTAYFTRPRKDRLTLIEILTQGNLCFQLNQQALDLMMVLGLSEKQQKRLLPKLSDKLMTRSEMDEVLMPLFPNPDEQATNRRRIIEACALTAYHQQLRPFPILVCDDAPQFKNLTEFLALCWVHEGRHFKRLKPFIAEHRVKVENVLTAFWDFYHALLAYKKAPSNAEAERLSTQFDSLFGQQTDYDLLDERLQKTLAKKESLLLVLKYPEIPLHNNPAELEARVQARKRDVSLQTKNDKGTQAKDTMMTIVQTARKLKVNIFDYIYDRVSRKLKMPSLASLISAKSQVIPDTG